jgi:broad specificity phosphatase PhoE
MKSSYWVTVTKIAGSPEARSRRLDGGDEGAEVPASPALERTLSVEIVYETHSISVDNERGVATGWLDGELSERGRESARALGERRRDGGFAVVFSSDLGRARETAEIALGDSGIPMVFDVRLRECNYGELNGAPVARIERERSRRINEPYPGGESYRDVVERVRDFLDDLGREYDGKRVLIISHAAPRWALEHLLRGTPLEELVDAPFEWQEGWTYEYSP